MSVELEAASFAPNSFDVVIVGGGPAGLNAALLLARACRRVLVIDEGHPRNGAAVALHGFLSRDGIQPSELLAKGRCELSKYGVQFLHSRASRVERCTELSSRAVPTLFQILTDDGIEHFARKILFATGTKDCLPDIPGLKECFGATVHHCPYCDGWEHRNQRLVAYGEDPKEGVGIAIALRGWSGHVIVLTNGKSASPEDVVRLRNNRITLIEERVLRLVHEGNQLRAVECEKVGQIGADALFINTRQHIDSELPRALGCEINSDSSVRTESHQCTNVAGVYLAGDASGGVQMAIIAAAEGATAAVAINRELQNEDEQLRALRVKG